MKANRMYKDSVFSSFLGEPRRLVEIYNAVEGTEYPLDTPVEINTLTDVLWHDRINDLSFTLNGQMMVLIEHQSTLNDNMALRMLLYVARLYEKLVPESSIYRRRRLGIPTPKFIVLYAGRESCPEHQTQRLSDAFLSPEENPMLELTVDVYNISYQQSPQIIEKSQSLREYSAFVHAVEAGAAKGLLFAQAVAEAIRYCIKHDIMREYLLQHGSEVENMLLTEWNNDDALAVWKEELEEEIREKLQEQYLEEGRAKGKAEGLVEGEENARRADILALRDLLPLEVLAERFQVPLDYVLQILQDANKEE